ncbi:MAG: RNA-binding protein [Proteobacteria bacterium]|nr:RNA-binding protein [Pseudomonadota bacterium]
MERHGGFSAADDQHLDALRRAPARPLRRCIASGEMRPKEALIRFVAAPDGTVVPDLAERLPGRGLWLSPQRDVMARACARNLFARAAKRSLRVPDDLVDSVERMLTRRCLDLVGLAKRSGQAVSGYQRVAASLATGRAAVLLAAVDAAEEGRRKLRALARARGLGTAVVELFTAEELGRAMGHDARVHVAVAPGGVAARLAKEIARLESLRGQAPEEGEGPLV